ncbi:MAG: hypothetical protein AAFN77_10820 [Planctomycetota bacterium]
MNQFHCLMPRARPHGRRQRNGLSLLEVILSIAILGGAMVAIGKLYFLGYRSALQTRYRSECNMIADAKMAELAGGVLPLESGGGPVEENPDWMYTVDVQQSLQPGLLLSTVTVTRTDNSNIPISISLVRMIPDPDYEPEEDEG